MPINGPNPQMGQKGRIYPRFTAHCGEEPGSDAPWARRQSAWHTDAASVLVTLNQVHPAGGLDAPGRSEVVRRALSGIRRIRATQPTSRASLVLRDV